MSLEREPTIEKPKYRIMFTRHANRLSTGELSEPGKKKAEKKGTQLGKSAGVLKGYGSDHPSKRATDTADLMSEGSGIHSPLTGEQYQTREVRHFQYDVLAPDLTKHLKIAKSMINKKTLRDAGLSTEQDKHGNLKIDVENLPPDTSQEERERLALIRQDNQKFGLQYLLSQLELVQRLAGRMGERFVHEIEVLDRTQKMKKENQPKKDVLLNNVGHGLFAEALFQKAAVYIDDKGNEHEGIDIGEDQFGGYLEPLESFSIDLEDPSNPPELIPVTFDRPDRPHGKVFLKLSALKELAANYNEWKKSQEKKK